MTPFAFYGTLMEGGRLASALSGLGHHGQHCMIRGTLYDLGPFPALAYTLQDGEVRGQLWRPATSAALDRVDYIEGAGRLYRRELVRLVDPEVDAWVYVALRQLGAYRVVESGDWTEYTAARS